MSRSVYLSLILVLSCSVAFPLDGQAKLTAKNKSTKARLQQKKPASKTPAKIEQKVESTAAERTSVRPQKVIEMPAVIEDPDMKNFSTPEGALYTTSDEAA